MLLSETALGSAVLWLRFLGLRHCCWPFPAFLSFLLLLSCFLSRALLLPLARQAASRALPPFLCCCGCLLPLSLLCCCRFPLLLFCCCCCLCCCLCFCCCLCCCLCFCFSLAVLLSCSFKLLSRFLLLPFLLFCCCFCFFSFPSLLLF